MVGRLVVEHRRALTELFVHAVGMRDKAQIVRREPQIHARTVASSSVIVLTPVHGDREALLPLLLEADESEPVLRSYLHEGELFEISEDGSVVGVVLLIPEGDDLEIKNIAVAEEHRGRGIGTAAIAAVTELARAGGARRLTVGTAETSEAAIRFYLRSGFTPSDVRSGFFDSYPDPVVEGSLIAHDMLLFSRDL